MIPPLFMMMKEGNTAEMKQGRGKRATIFDYAEFEASVKCCLRNSLYVAELSFVEVVLKLYLL